MLDTALKGKIIFLMANRKIKPHRKRIILYLIKDNVFQHNAEVIAGIVRLDFKASQD